MRICLIILFCFIASTGSTQVNFVCNSGAFAQSPINKSDLFTTINKNVSIFFGLGVNYKINEKLSIDQLLYYNFQDNQIPVFRGLDQKEKTHYLNMQFHFNYKVSPIWEPYLGFRFGSIFFNDFISGPRGLLQSEGYDIVMMTGIKANLNHKLQVFIQHDLLFLQTQQYASWFTLPLGDRKNKIFYLGLNYLPFKKQSK